MQRALPGAVNLPLTQEGPGRNPGHVATRMRRGFRLERKRLMLREVADLIMAVDRKFWEHHLAEAERQIADGERLIARQRKLVVELERDGHDTARGRNLLTQFEELLAAHVSERDRLRAGSISAIFAQSSSRTRAPDHADAAPVSAIALR
jgi:hypothetical protein